MTMIITLHVYNVCTYAYVWIHTQIPLLTVPFFRFEAIIYGFDNSQIRSMVMGPDRIIILARVHILIKAHPPMRMRDGRLQLVDCKMEDELDSQRRDKLPKEVHFVV